MLAVSFVLLVPAIGLSIVCLTYSITFMWLASTRGRGGRPSATHKPRQTIYGDKWLIVIPALGNVTLLETCVSNALRATSAADAVIVVAIDDRDQPSRLRARGAVERGAKKSGVHDLSQGQGDGTPIDSASQRVICVPTGALLNQCSRGGKASAVNLGVSCYLYMEQDELRNGMFDRTSILYLLCLDVDERLTADGFSRLRTTAVRNPQTVLIQAPKRDLPVTRSLFARAFSAAYSSWFKWEAGWPTGRSSPGAGSSYYGSMAAIKLSPEMLRHRRTIESGGARRIELFPEDCPVEDYPFSLALSPHHGTLLLDQPIGVGCAPPDMGALFALWHRWAQGNISAIAGRLRVLLWQPGQSIGQRVARIHHALSWYVTIAVGVLPIALVGPLVCRSHYAIYTLLLICVALGGEWIRRLVPAWPAARRDLALRLPVDMLLWPIGVHAIVGAWRGGAWRGRRSPFPPTTPRVSGSCGLPSWIWCAYGVEVVVLGYAVTLVVGARHTTVSVLALVLAGVPFGVGMFAAWHDRRLSKVEG